MNLLIVSEKLCSYEREFNFGPHSFQKKHNIRIGIIAWIQQELLDI